ncbi:uncharacterized protein JN550_009928 [Neoarthrinium moseri]|uniref:uncharacterized protein n=1 Tax=Neoarthrinium moseri TaxID=1658444 RepID=UPI001FDC9D2F|nr:uncharacterized protein JN550_009928 [Neoarthrinium moseri]KAI1862781.1 hypothetical protein JN550_009928 [Neoarthrinium moseri]
MWRPAQRKKHGGMSSAVQSLTICRVKVKDAVIGDFADAAGFAGPEQVDGFRQVNYRGYRSKMASRRRASRMMAGWRAGGRRDEDVLPFSPAWGVGWLAWKGDVSVFLAVAPVGRPPPAAPAESP